MGSKSEISKERAKQARGAMSIIGPLLDSWEGMSNDLKGELECDSPEFVEYMEKLANHMEFGS